MAERMFAVAQMNSCRACVPPTSSEILEAEMSNYRKPCAVLLAVCALSLPLFGQKNSSAADKRKDKQYLREQEKKLADVFLHMTVIAKVAMPLTTQGVSVSWDKKKSEWVLDPNQLHMQKYGVGVKAGDRYTITRVDAGPAGATFWLNDGGAIDTATQLADSWAWAGNVLQRMEHNQEMQRMQSSANGGRVHIYTYQLPKADDLLVIAKEQSLKVFQIEDALPTPAVASGERNGGVMVVTSDPDGAEIWVDNSFRGQAPAKLVLPPGKHSIRLSLQGFEEWKRDVEAVNGSEARLSVRLTKQVP
jgi:hypothetical protein